MSGSDSYIWGPPAWAVFHQKALDSCASCDQDRLADFYQRDFYRYIRCDTCRREYTNIIRTIRPDYSSPEALFRWTVTVHNIVNNKLGKPMVPLLEAYRIWGGCDGIDDYDCVFEFRV